MRGNPTWIAAGTKAEPHTQQISYCVAIGYALQSALAHELPPAVVNELLTIAAAAGAIKHIAQQQLDKEMK